MTSPIFLTGVYRTGSTLLSRMLDVHPELAVTHDNVHFMRYCYNKYNPLNRENVQQLVNDIYNRINMRFKIVFSVNKVVEAVFGSKEPITYGLIYDKLMNELLLTGTEAKRWGEKTNLAWSSIPHFLQMFPKGKTILIIRDPRDVLYSFKKMTTAQWPDYLDAIFTSIDALQTAKKFLKTLSESSFFLFKYEDFIANPEEYTKKLCMFIEVDFDPQMLNVHNYRDRSKKKWRGETISNKPLCGISNKTVNRWRQVLKGEELLLTETLLREEMTDFGYSLSGKDFKIEDMVNAFSIIRKSELIKNRFVDWLRTGCGIEAYPSNPTDPKNWGNKK